MKDDFLDELSYLGIMARVKRLSDAMNYEVRSLYRTQGFDIEPGWHLVFLQLKRHKTRTMTQLAASFGLSQPAVVKMINKMKSLGYLEATRDRSDHRVRHLSLSKKAKDMLPVFEKVWRAGEKSMKKILGEDETFLTAMKAIEQKMLAESFTQRTLGHLSETKRKKK